MLKAGYNFGETAEMFRTSYRSSRRRIAPGHVPQHHRQHRHWRSASSPRRARAGLPLFLGSYPITPASDILHELSTFKNFDVFTFQAEDEIAGIGAALGAAFGGAIALTTTSGPGICLKAETINLAVSVELPLVIADIQRGGPSTGLPTKTEQADLLHGAVRPQQRLAGPDPRAGDAGRLLRRRVRGGAHRGQVHDAGHLPLRRLPRQRRRALADPDAPSDLPDITVDASAPTRRASSRTCAIPRRCRGRG